MIIISQILTLKIINVTLLKDKMKARKTYIYQKRMHMQKIKTYNNFSNRPKFQFTLTIKSLKCLKTTFISSWYSITLSAKTRFTQIKLHWKFNVSFYHLLAKSTYFQADMKRISQCFTNVNVFGFRIHGWLYILFS